MAIRVTGCPPEQEPEIQRLATLELRAYLVEDNEPGQSVTQAGVRCERELARLEVLDPVSGKRSSRTVRLADLPPEGQARYLALALAELVLASWSEVATNPTPTVPPIEASAKNEQRKAIRQIVEERYLRHASAWGFGVGGQVRRFDASAPLLVGGGVDLRWFARTGWQVRAGLDYGQGTTDTSRGDVSAGLATAALSAGYGWPLQRWTLSLHGGLRGGSAWLVGTPADEDSVGSTLMGPWLAPLVEAELDFEWADQLSTALGAEFGYAVRGVRGQVAGDEDVSLGAVTGAVQLRIRWWP